MARQIFISYSKKDSAFALKLAGELEEAGHRIWIDREIIPGLQWRKTIEQNLDDSASMIVIVSKNSVASRWVQHESSVMHGLHKTIIPVLIEPVLNSEHFVWMDEIQYIDFPMLGYENALGELLKALTPPNPVQDMLDQQVIAHRKTGDLIGEAMLNVIDEERDRLVVSPEAKDLIEESDQAVLFRRRLMRGGVGLVGVLVVVAIFAVMTAVEAGKRVQASGETIAVGEARITLIEGQQNLVAGTATEGALAATRQSSTSEAIFSTLEAQQQSIMATAVQAAADLADARSAIQKFFDESSLVLVEAGPRDMVWDGSRLWVANLWADTVQRIDPSSGFTVTVPVGSQPVGLDYHDGIVWVVNQDSDTLGRIRTATRTYVEYPVGDGPRAVLWVNDAVWVANEFDDTVQRIDPETGAVVAILEVDDSPVALAFDGVDLWVANFEGGSLERINVETNQVTGRFSNIEAGPADLLYANGSLWIANRVADTVQEFSPIQGRVLRTIPVADAPNALAWDGASIWVTNQGNDSVQMIDPQAPADEAVLRTFTTGDSPRSVVWDGESLWISNFDDNKVLRVSAIRRAEGAVVSSIVVGQTPQYILSTGRSLWVANQGSRSVEQIDLETMDVVASFQMEGLPGGLAYDGNNLWAADAENGVVMLIASRRGNRVELVELGEGESHVSVAVEGEPAGMLWDGSFLWVMDVGGNGLVQIDTAAMEVVQRISLAGRPGMMIFNEGSFWVTLPEQHLVLNVEAETGQVLNTINMGSATPVELVWDGASLWVAIEESPEIQRIDLEAGAVVGTVRVDEGTTAFWAAQGYIWMANAEAGTVQLLDTATNAIVQTIPVGGSPVALLMVEEDVWVVNEGASAVQIIEGEIVRLLIEAGAGGE